MGGHIAADVHAFFPAILLGIRESFIQSPVVKVVLELVGEIGILRTLVLRSPREAIVVLPLALERLAVTAPSPELRFLEKNGVDTCIDDRFDVPFLEVSKVVFGGDDVRDESSVPDGIALSGLLSFVEMPLAVPLPREIVLIFAPSYACHKVRLVTSLPPRFYTLAESHPAVIARPVNHHKV